MLRNYLLIAWRNLRKNKVFSFINVFGLALGMAASLLILQYVSHALSHDRFHARAGDIYRVVNDRYQNGKLIQHGTITYPAVGPTMKKDFPEVESFSRVTPTGYRTTVKAGNQLFVETRGFYADTSFLNIFSFPLLAGDPGKALKNSRTVVLSEDLARKYFRVSADRFQSVLGKVLYMGMDQEPYTVTGVMKNVPTNSFLEFDYLVSYQTLITFMQDGADTSWGNSDFYHFLLLQPGTDYKKLQAKFSDFSRRHLQGNKVSGSDEKFYLQPLTEAQLYSVGMEYEIGKARLGKAGNGKVVWALLLIALFIMLIAWINYVNLATTRSIERAKEVGIRKAVGASYKQLVGQFLTESLLLNAVALVIAVTLVQVAQPFFNALAGEKLSLGLLLGGGYGGFYTPLVLGTLIVAGVLVSGGYPAFTLSAYEPVKVLKGKFGHSNKGILLRKTLVVFQYTVSIALIAGTFAVFHQIRYMTQKDLGLSIDQTLVVYGPQQTQFDSSYVDRLKSLKQEVKRLPTVKDAATSARLPGDRWSRIFSIKLVGGNTKENLSSSNLFVDYDFIRMFGIKMLAGREFTESDHNVDFRKITNIIINQKAAELLGFTSVEAAVNRQVSFFGKTWDIVGVMDNFHQQSLQHALEPVVFIPGYNTDGFYSFKVSTANLPETIARIEETFHTLFPGNTFEYFFLDDLFNRQYQGEMTFGRLTVTFSLLTIFIACLGLFGLSLLTTAQRTKEIGVRKVLGASIYNLLLLLSKDFIRLVLLANLIAWPVAFLGIREWLDNYAFRIAISPWLFVLPTLLVLLVALLTVSFQTIKAARSNPVKSLRYE